MGAEVEEDWFLWRPVVAGIARKTEIDTTWSLDDLLMCNLAMTYSQEQQADAERRAHEQARREAGR